MDVGGKRWEAQPPYYNVEKPEWPEEGGDEKAVAKETWEGYKKRNKSIIVDLFQSVYKSMLVYPECSKVPWDARKRTLAIKIKVPKDSNYGYLKKLFAKWFGVEAENFLAAEVWSHKFYKFYDDYVNLTKLTKKYTLVVYELPVPVKYIAKRPQTSSFTFGAKPKLPPKPDPNAPFLLPGFHISEAQRSTVFGVPFFVLLTPAKASSRGRSTELWLNDAKDGKDEDGEGELVEQTSRGGRGGQGGRSCDGDQATSRRNEGRGGSRCGDATCQEIVAKEEASTEHAQDDGELASLADPQGEEDLEVIATGIETGLNMNGSCMSVKSEIERVERHKMFEKRELMPLPLGSGLSVMLVVGAT
ncbi:ubiquitin-specific protease [Rhizoctonia solani]|uniref:Ubiquitin-specific protease n=1 Tax=Rhizoctonia solani TaxID=456999 RepID=A0A8H7I3J2_9AGAM|nr:ubiquitin-specific protease [Rhizoctonia solani]